MATIGRSPVLLQVALIASAVIVGIALGAWVGVALARGGDALVAGATIVMCALGGAIVGLIGGAISAWKLPARLLRRTTVLLAVPALVLLLLGVRAAWLLDQQTRDPESAYAGLPVFVAVLERDPAGDPYLSPRVEVNAIERAWRTRLRDGRSCHGRLRAKVQRRVAAVLPDGPVPPACGSGAANGSIERISWQIQGGASGAVLLTPSCRKAMPQAIQLARLVSMASGLADSRPSCD